MTRRQWLQALGSRCAPLAAAAEAEVKLREYTAAMQDVPREAFCPESLEAAARQFEFFPAYAALRKFLEVWWEDRQRNSRPALPGLDDPTLTEDDRHHLAVFQRHRADEFTDPHTARLWLGLRLGWIRHGPLVRVYRHICRTDAEAAAIAVQRGWEVDPVSREEHTPEEIEAIERSRMAAIAAMGETRREPRSTLGPADVVVAPRVRSRADDLALLANLRADPRLPGRAARIGKLCEALGVKALPTDPTEAGQAPPEPDDVWISGRRA